jgi:hypothetical protein
MNNTPWGAAMSRQQSLLAMHAMLDFVANEAGKAGDALVSSLAAAADEAVLEEIAKAHRSLNGRKIVFNGKIAEPEKTACAPGPGDKVIRDTKNSRGRAHLMRGRPRRAVSASRP